MIGGAGDNCGYKTCTAPFKWLPSANQHPTFYRAALKNDDERKKHSEKCKHCVLAVAKNFRTAADPLPGGEGPPKFNKLDMVTTFTYKPSLVRIDARNIELSW